MGERLKATIIIVSKLRKAQIEVSLSLRCSCQFSDLRNTHILNTNFMVILCIKIAPDTKGY